LAVEAAGIGITQGLDTMNSAILEAKENQQDMSAKIPGGGFFPAAGFSALANVGGGGRRLLGYRDGTRPFRGPASRLGPGIVLLAFTMLDENFPAKPKIRSSVFETPYTVLFPMVLALLLLLLLLTS
jgi:hypothetical protein